MRVMITDGNERAALAVTRALGQKEVEVIVGAETARSLAGESRYCYSSFQYPSSYTDPNGFAQVLLDMVRQKRADVLIPVSDMAMQLVGEHLAEFESHTKIPVPPLAVYESVSDKVHLARMAKELEVPLPDTIVVDKGWIPEDLTSVGEFPLIVKPARSRIFLQGKWINTRVESVANRKELEELYHRTPYLQLPSLIQRKIEGEGQGLFALCDRGKPVALFAHRRLREKPPSGGVSVLRESIELPKVMAEHALRLLQSVEWHGVAMVEFKIERRTGLPRLMEINGRFWGSLQLALDAGINFPFLLCQLASGRRPEVPAGGYRVGVKSRWLLGDLDHLLARLLKSDNRLDLPPGYPSRVRCALEFLRFFQKDMHYEVERWDDAGPARHEVRTYVRSIMVRPT